MDSEIGDRKMRFIYILFLSSKFLLHDLGAETITMSRALIR